MFAESLGSVSGLLGAGAVGINPVLALSTGQQLFNSYMQYKNYNYQKDLQKDIFSREDNSVLRRTLDLKRAGLSPVLAAGNGASAGAVVNTTAPQTGDIAGAYANLIKMSNDIAVSQTQRELMEDQKKLVEAQKTKTDYEGYQAYHDYLIYKYWGMPSNASSDLQKIGFLKGAISDVAKDIKGPEKPEYPPSKQMPGESNRAYYQRKLIEQREREEKERLGKKYK